MFTDPWSRMESNLQRGIEASMGTVISIEPRITRPNKPPVADSSRPALACLPAVIVKPSAEVRLKQVQTTIQTRSTELQIRQELIPFDLRQGDVVIDHTTGARYAVLVVRPNGHGTACCPLEELGIADQQ